MAKIANKQVICDVLMREAEKDKDIVALCSDSRGSAFFFKICRYLSGTVYRNRNSRTESGEYFRRTCEMWKKTICCFAGLLFIYQKL